MLTPSAQKYSKILYFTKDSRMKKLIEKVSEPVGVTKKPDKHYPYNCISKHFPLARLLKGNDRAQLVLPCGFKNGESWGALRKAWIGYKVAKREGDETLMREYAARIQKLEEELGIPTASFPNLGMLGDIFFLYDKEKEMNLRQQYMFDNVQCDKFGIDNLDVQQMVDSGQAKLFDNKAELKRFMDKEHYDALLNQFQEWVMDEKTQAYVRASQKKWARRNEIKNELKRIKEEIAVLNDGKYLKGQARIDKRNKRQFLMQQKILKESELKSVQTMSLVKTDTGWKYAKEIIQNNLRTKIKYDYEPTYYLTDLNGHRLANYHEEKEYLNDPHFYRLYLEDKEWEKIYSQQ